MKAKPEEPIREVWRSDGAMWLWFRWWVASRITMLGTGMLVGAGALGVRFAFVAALGAWGLSVLARMNAQRTWREGTHGYCASCGKDCGTCLAREMAKTATEVK